VAEQLSHAEVLGRYVGTFVDELAAAGVENVCLCPGSRSTPLALTFERHPNIKTWMHLDERSCAYFALGMARASDSPIAILCSSGTAAVNFAPAVVEAFHSHVPLIVLTADRPPELQGLGANQTIDQVNLYGTAVKWFTQMPLPEASGHMLRYARMVADRTVSTALATPRGPVHVNLPFREPLMPAENFSSESKGRMTDGAGLQVVGSSDLEWLLEHLQSSKRGLIVCGPQDDPDLRNWNGAQYLSDMTGMPLLVDPVSQIRGYCHPHNTLGLYDNYLRVASVADGLKPDLILRFGAPPTSKPLATYLHQHADVLQIAVAPGRGWPDPDLTAGRVIDSDAATIWDAITKYSGSKVEDRWGLAWRRMEETTRETITRLLGSDESISEPGVFYHLEAELPAWAGPQRNWPTVFAGNSMPIRDMDSFFPPTSKGVRCLANRGASGIDGVVSTALGASTVSQGPTVLVIGDLSFYHDMNGLLAAKRFGLKATIVLINNDGGGIFSFLPQHDDAQHFEALWGTPHGLDFSHVAGLYGIGFQRVTTRDEYKAALKASFEADGVQVIEIKTDREENLRLHQRIWDEVATAVKDVALP
jgi:2-succinyl-5-enolpyruvyl-6-hydroxy-3-cyclohexene-1-carboxylate synthase